MSDGRDLHRSGHQARHRQPRRVRGVLCLLQRPEPGAPESDAGADACARLFQMLRLRFDPEPDVCPTAAFEPDELVWPRVVRRAFSDPRVPHESTGVARPRHRRSQDQRRQRPRQGGRGRIHDRVRTARRRRLVPRYPEDVLGAGASRSGVREEESRHVADDRRGDRSRCAKTS